MSQYASVGWIDTEEELDATYIRRDDYMAKGQIGTYNTAIADFDLLPPGTNGYVLSADSLSTYGLTWIPAPDGLASVATRNWGAGTGRNVGTADNVVIGNTATSTGNSQTVVIGSSAAATANDAVGIGYDITVGNQSVAILGNAPTVRSTVVGYNSSTAANDVTLYGYQNRVGLLGTANTLIGIYNGALTLTGSDNILCGDSNGQTITTGSQNSFYGSNINVAAGSTSASTAIGSLITVNSSSVAAGTSVSCLGNNTVCIGSNSSCDVVAANSVLVAPNGAATADSTVTLGYLASNAGQYSITIGRQSSATVAATNSCVLGRQAVATADACISIGYLTGTALISGARCVLIGQQATANTAAVDAIAIGSSAFAGGNFSIAIGSGANIGTEGVSLGGFTTAARNTIGGALTVSQAANSTLWGYNQRCGAGATGTVLYGYVNGRDLMTGTNNVGVGNNCFNNTITTGSNNVFLGNTIDVLANSTISSVGVGSTLTLSTSSVAIGQNLSAAGTSSIVIGSGSSTTAAATGSVVIGATTISEGSNNVCIGSLAKNKMAFAVVIGYNAGNNTNTASNNVIIGQSAGQSTSAAQNSIFGASADVSSGRSHCTVLGYTATASQNQCVVVGSSSSCTAVNSNALGYDVDNTTTNTTRIGSNKSADHTVDSEGLFRSVNQVHCVATGTGQVIAVAGPTKATLTAEQSSYPAGLRDVANNWVYLSAAGTECANRTYSLMTTIKATAGTTNNRWQVVMQLVEPGVGTREVAWGELCASIANECATTLCTVTKINGAITSRPYFYIELTRVAGAGTVDINNIAESFSRIA